MPPRRRTRYRRPVDNPDDRSGGSSFDDVFSEGPSGGGSTSSTTRKPLGVPDDYVATVPRNPESFRGMSPRAVEGWYTNVGGVSMPRPRQVAPRYFDGDEWRPAALGPEAIAQMQRDMWNAGILDDGFQLGRWDEATRGAYKQILAEANASGLSDVSVLAQAAQSPRIGSGDEESGGRTATGFDENGMPIWETYTPPPLEIKTTNPDDLRSVFRRSVIETLGQGWSQAQIDELVDAYRWQEVRVQREAYDQQVALERAEFEGTRDPAGGEVISTVDVASPESFIENEMIRRDPQQYMAGRMVTDAIPAFMQAIRGWTG